MYCLTIGYINRSFNWLSYFFKKIENLRKKNSNFKFDKSKFKENKNSEYIVFSKGHP